MKRIVRRRDERGESLVELLVTISIIALAVVLLVGALADAILASSTHRQHATADTVARNVSEALKDRNLAFDTNGNYAASAWSGVNTNGFSVSVPTAKCWAGDTPATFGNCPNGDRGLQQITITVTANTKGEKEQISILKRRT